MTSMDGSLWNLEDQPLASGGEGNIYKVSSSGFVAKVFHSEEKAQKTEKKIEYLCRFGPSRTNRAGTFDLIWPQKTLFKNGAFNGYVMREVNEQAVKLTYLTLPNAPGSRLGSDWKEFDQASPNSQVRRLNIALNIARAVKRMGERYQMLDLKPENILVEPSGLVHLIDLDSVQIRGAHNVLFPAGATTLEYSPAEHHAGKVNFETDLIESNWVSFSFAVIAYELLLGIHPFTGCFWGAPFDQFPQNYQSFIQHGLYPNGKNRPYLDGAPAYPHQRIQDIPQKIQLLWRKTFDEGSSDPTKRPAIEDWISILKIETRRFRLINAQPNQIRANSKLHSNSSLRLRS